MSDASQTVLILVRDLMFSTRIVEAARAAGVPFKVIRSLEKLPGEIGRMLIVDLNQEGATRAAGEWGAATGNQTLGFVSHVDAEAIAEAKSVGIDQILSRGQFTQSLPELIRA